MSLLQIQQANADWRTRSVQWQDFSTQQSAHSTQPLAKSQELTAKSPELRAAVNSRHPLRNAAENLVRHALAQPRQFDCIHALAVARTDADDLVSHRNARNVPDIDHG